MTLSSAEAELVAMSKAASEGAYPCIQIWENTTVGNNNMWIPTEVLLLYEVRECHSERTISGGVWRLVGSKCNSAATRMWEA